MKNGASGDHPRINEMKEKEKEKEEWKEWKIRKELISNPNQLPTLFAKKEKQEKETETSTDVQLTENTRGSFSKRAKERKREKRRKSER